jgi:nucleolar complex protein 3
MGKRPREGKGSGASSSSHPRRGRGKPPVKKNGGGDGRGASAVKRRRRRDADSNVKPPTRDGSAASEDEDEESDEVSDEDVRFVRKNAAYASFMTRGAFDDDDANGKDKRGRRADADSDALENAHAAKIAQRREEEERERIRRENLPDEEKPLKLPVKRLDGTVVRDATAPTDAGSEEDDDAEDGGGGGDDDDAEDDGGRRGRWRDVGGGDSREGLGKKAMAREIRESDLGRETTTSKKNEKWWEKQEEEKKKKAREAEEKASAKRKKSGDSDDSDSESESDDPAMKLADKRRAERLALEAEMSAEARRESVKLRLATTCQSLIEDPETRWKELKDLNDLCEDRDSEVARLAALSLALVFRDVCPGYRIRPLTDKEKNMKVSKDVMKTRNFEAGLLVHYKAYVKTLIRCSGAKKSRSQRGKGGPDTESAIKCLCALLTSLPTFNYRTDILSALIPVLNSRDADHAQIVSDALSDVVANDVRGELTLEALHMTAQLVKQNKCAVRPCAFAYILNVRFDEGILVPMVRDQKEVLSRKQTFKKKQEEREKIRKARAEKARKQQEKERMRSFGHVDDSSDESEDEEAAFNRDLEEGQAVMSFGEKKKMQSRLLEATFEMYFRVLKNASSPAPTPGLPMLSAALTGLAKFTHLISIDFLGDLMEAFRKLLAKTDLLSDALKAQTLLTACEILSGHGEVLQIDTGEFYRQLYVMLGKPSSGSSGWQDGISSTDTRVMDHGTLRVRAIQRFIGGFKQVDQARMAAFSKRLASASMGMEAGECLGSLGVVRQILASYPRVRNLLENERIGNGVFQMDLDDPEHAQGLSAVLWDLCLLARHYHPTCAAAAQEVANLPLSGAIAPPPGSHAPSELARAYSSLRGGFNPPMQEPTPPRNAPKPPAERRGFVADDFTKDFALALRASSSSSTTSPPSTPTENALPSFRKYFSRTRAHRVHAEMSRLRARHRRVVDAIHAHKAERDAMKSSKKPSSKKTSRKK